MQCTLQECRQECIGFESVPNREKGRESSYYEGCCSCTYIFKKNKDPDFNSPRYMYIYFQLKVC